MGVDGGRSRHGEVLYSESLRVVPSAENSHNHDVNSYLEVLAAGTTEEELREAFMRASGRTLGDGTGARSAAWLMAAHSHAERTAGSRATEWRAFCEFWAEGGRQGPVDGNDLVCFVGWLSEQRVSGKRNVSSRSLAQYLSAVRTVHAKLQIQPLPPTPASFPPLGEVVRAYRRWESGRFEVGNVRIGIASDSMQVIWQRAMDERATLDIVRDAAAVLFAYVFGLRESSVGNVTKEDIAVLNPLRCEVMVRFVKGRTSHEAVRRGPRSYDVAGLDTHSPLDVLLKYVGAFKGDGSLFASGRRSKGWLTKALRGLLDCCGIRPPINGTYSSHSLRIGSLTERILLGESTTELLASYDWAHTSDGMLSVYFDRRIRLSPSSRWFFKCRDPRE